MTQSFEQPFFSKERIFNYSRIRMIYILAAAGLYMLTELGRFVYRPYIYQHAINDLGFADVVGNLFGTIAIIFVELGITHATRKQGMRIIAFVTAGVTLYELAQSILPKGVMDWKDVIATLIAGIAAMGIFLLIWRKHPESSD